jgi:hypothetical protein
LLPALSFAGRNSSIMRSSLLIVFTCIALLNGKLHSQTSTVNFSQEIKPDKMKEYSFLVRVPVSYSKEQVASAGVKWNLLLDQWKTDSIYIISFPFPADGYVVTGKEKAVSKEAVVADNLKVVSNIFLRAPTMENAIELAKSFPILEYEGTVEIREILPRPVTANN